MNSLASVNRKLYFRQRAFIQTPIGV